MALNFLKLNFGNFFVATNDTTTADAARTPSRRVEKRKYELIDLTDESAKPTTKSTTDSPFDSKPLTTKAQTLLNEMKQGLADEWLTKLSTCGGQKPRGHSAKIGMQGALWSPDGMKLPPSKRTAEHRVRTQTIGLLINRYDPTNRTGLQTSAFSKAADNKFVNLGRRFIEEARPGT